MKKINVYTFFVILFINLAFCATTFAQNATLKGTLLDDKTDEPLISATIAIAGGVGTVTDFDGNYELLIPAGTHTVTFDFLGYKALEQKITVEAAEERVLNIRMQENITLLQTATVTSGRYEKPLGEVTVSLDVLKPELIENNNSTSVDQILEKIPGVNIIDGQANIRGGSGYSYGAGSRVMLLIDDIPALQADAGYPNWSDIPVENVEQIEVIKGAASALYGSSALNGIVNVRTAYAKLKPETHFSTFYTHYDRPNDRQKHWWKDGEGRPLTTGFSVGHRQKFGKLDLVASGYFLYEDSWNKDTWNHFGRATLGLRYRATDRLSFGFNSNVNIGNSNAFFYWANGEEGAMTGAEGTFSTSDKVRYFIDPFLTYFDKKGNRHKLMTRLYSVTNSVSGGRSNNSDLYYGEYQFQRKFENIGLVTTAGVVGYRTNINAELYGGDLFQSGNTAAYLQVDKKFFNKLNISGGVRYEYNQISAPDSIAIESLIGNETVAAGTAREGKPIFRIGANYQVGEYTYLRSSWGQGYRFPTIAEKFISTDVGFQILPNVDLHSETGWSAEIGIKQGFRVSNWDGFLDVAAFWSEYRDMMEFTFTTDLFAFQSQNIGNTIVRGIDVSVLGQGSIGGMKTNLIAGYTYLDPKFQNFTASDEQNSTADYNVLKYRYRHTWKFDVETHVTDKFSIALAANHTSEMEAIDNLFNEFIEGLKEYRINNDESYTIFDVRLAYQITDKIKVSALAKNILNEEYSQRPALIEEPRNFTAKISVKF